jgi:hypothetical protein
VNLLLRAGFAQPCCFYHSRVPTQEIDQPQPTSPRVFPLPPTAPARMPPVSPPSRRTPWPICAVPAASSTYGSVATPEPDYLRGSIFWDGQAQPAVDVPFGDFTSSATARSARSLRLSSPWRPPG